MPTATATKWTRGTVTVNWFDDSAGAQVIRETPGIVLGNIGIVDDRKLKGWYGGPAYRLAHIPSGLGFGHTFDRLRDAKATGEAILAIEGADELLDEAANHPVDYNGPVARKIRETFHRMWRESIR